MARKKVIGTTATGKIVTENSPKRQAEIKRALEDAEERRKANTERKKKRRQK